MYLVYIEGVRVTSTRKILSPAVALLSVVSSSFSTFPLLWLYLLYKQERYRVYDIISLAYFLYSYYTFFFIDNGESFVDVWSGGPPGREESFCLLKLLIADIISRRYIYEVPVYDIKYVLEYLYWFLLGFYVAYVVQLYVWILTYFYVRQNNI